MSSPGKEKFVMKGDSYYCSYCDKEFKTYYDLASHNWDEHAEIMFGGRQLRSSTSRNSLRRNSSRPESKGAVAVDRKPIVLALMSPENQGHGSTSLGKRPRITNESSGSEDENENGEE